MTGPPTPRSDPSELYRRWWAAVVDLAARRLGNWEEAEAVAQEALLRAIDAAEREEIRSFGAYVLRVAANLATDQLRRREWQARREDPDLVEAPPDPDRSELVRLRAAVDGLSPQQREIVELRYVDGRSFAEIAEVLGMSKNGVFARHERAIDALRTVFRRRRT
jgi:RNA polymerase sigma-70 factor (ECF subfamily)